MIIYDIVDREAETYQAFIATHLLMNVSIVLFHLIFVYCVSLGGICIQLPAA